MIIGAGAAGVAVASSLRARSASLDIVLVDPADRHAYQPGWTMVGAGVFTAESTSRPMDSVIPRGVRRIRASVTQLDLAAQRVLLEDGSAVPYGQLVVCPGLELDWDAIDGLRESLGRNGVTSNYRADLAPYTWQLVRKLPAGRAIFTQPAMPIKCAGAPQKAMYLSADHWRRSGCLGRMDIEFRTAGSALFGVPQYVPALMDYVKTYGADLCLAHNLVAVDGPARKATFSIRLPDGSTRSESVVFDMLHAVPPQRAPRLVRESELADSGGWADVDPHTLRHRRFPNVFALGDVTGTGNAKTVAAARKQAPVVAHNVLRDCGLAHGEARYDGYGACPLTVERGKVVLAEFLYGGVVAPTFPRWLLDGTRASRLAWLLKRRVLPEIYWNAMLKGREWLAAPRVFTS